MARVDEIAPDLFRISTFVPEIGIQFNQFLVRDDEPLLFETGRFIQQGPLAHYMPYTSRTEGQLRGLAALKPQLCATMHGSAFRGDGARALLDMARVMKDLLG